MSLGSYPIEDANLAFFLVQIRIPSKGQELFFL